MHQLVLDHTVFDVKYSQYLMIISQYLMLNTPGILCKMNTVFDVEQPRILCEMITVFDVKHKNDGGKSDGTSNIATANK